MVYFLVESFREFREIWMKFPLRAYTFTEYFPIQLEHVFFDGNMTNRDSSKLKETSHFYAHVPIYVIKTWAVTITKATEYHFMLGNPVWKLNHNLFNVFNVSSKEYWQEYLEIGKIFFYQSVYFCAGCWTEFFFILTRWNNFAYFQSHLILIVT